MFVVIDIFLAFITIFSFTFAAAFTVIVTATTLTATAFTITIAVGAFAVVLFLSCFGSPGYDELGHLRNIYESRLD